MSGGSPLQERTNLLRAEEDDDDVRMVQTKTKTTSRSKKKEEGEDRECRVQDAASRAKEVVEGKKRPEKSEKEIMLEIQAIIRQITASVTFLPLLSDPCSFDLLVYTKKDTSVPGEWEDSDPRYILNSERVKLRSFTTKVHKVDTMVSYKLLDE